MTTRLRRSGLAGFGLLALSLAGASFAWACAPQATVRARPSSGLAGSQITVSAAGFREAPVAIYWGSESGPVLATHTGPTFSVSVTIPNESPGVYYITAQHTGDLAYSHPSATTSFTVTAPPPSEPAPAPAPSGGEQSPAPSPAVSTGQQASPSPAPAAAARRDTSPVRSVRARPVAPRTAAAPAAPAPAAAEPATPAPESVVLPATPAPEPEPAAQPLAVVSADLWSGFDTAESKGVLADRQTPAGSTNGSALPVGIGLLAVGMIGLLFGAGSMVTARRRQRVIR